MSEKLVLQLYNSQSIQGVYSKIDVMIQWRSMWRMTAISTIPSNWNTSNLITWNLQQPVFWGEGCGVERSLLWILGQCFAITLTKLLWYALAQWTFFRHATLVCIIPVVVPLPDWTKTRLSK